MAFCVNCGQKLIAEAKFCANCGKAVNINNSTPERKKVYDGEIHKCVQCGEVLEAFVSKCPTCGYELRGVKNSNAVRAFAEKIEQIENRRVIDNDFKKKKKKLGDLGKIHPIDEQKISLIRSFSIPNTKEDIYEFMILAGSNIDLKLYSMIYHGSQFQGMLIASQKAVSDAWLAKFEQAYQKAKVTFGDSSEIIYLEGLYKQKMKEIKWKKLLFPFIIAGYFLIMIIFSVVMIIL